MVFLCVGTCQSPSCVEYVGIEVGHQEIADHLQITT